MFNLFEKCILILLQNVELFTFDITTNNMPVFFHTYFKSFSLRAKISTSELKKKIKNAWVFK